MATPGKPIVFLVGKAHAVDYEHYQGIASILGALLVDLSGPQPLVSLPLLMEKGEAQALVLAHNFFVSKPVSEEDELKSNVGKSTQTSHLSLRQ